jgi:hypothetical protein
MTAAGLAGGSLTSEVLAGAGFAATGFRFTCLIAGLASVGTGAGMMPGDCARAGPAPSSNESITRNAP